MTPHRCRVTPLRCRDDTPQVSPRHLTGVDRHPAGVTVTPHGCQATPYRCRPPRTVLAHPTRSKPRRQWWRAQRARPVPSPLLFDRISPSGDARFEPPVGLVQGASDPRSIDPLSSLLTSEPRARILEALFASPGRIWRPAELARIAEQNKEVVRKEIQRLVAASVLSETLLDGGRGYRIDLSEPTTRDLGRYVQQTRGRVPAIRAALRALHVPTIAWAVGARRARSRATRPPRSNGHSPRNNELDLIVLTSAPRPLVTVQLSGPLTDPIGLTVMSISEWVKSIEGGDAFLLSCRRARKLWVLGSWDELVRRERADVEMRNTLKAALANWREELSDEWDEDWDPAAAAPLVLPIRAASPTLR